MVDAGDISLDASYEDWQLVGSSYFSRCELYSLPWGRTHRGGPGINLEYMRVFSCPFGGPIALCRDETKVVLQLGAFSRPDIQLFSAAGHPMGRILWDSGHILDAGWTSEEELLVVNDRGQVQRFTASGAPSTSKDAFSLGAACSSEGLVAVVVFPDGVVAQTATGHLWCVENAAEPRAQRFPDPAPSGGAIHCLAAMPPSCSASSTLEVIVAVDSTLVVEDARGVVPTAVHQGPIVKLAPSPDGRYIAGVAADDMLYIWDSSLEHDALAALYLQDTAADFEDSLGLVVNSLPSGAPNALVWCGSDAVLAAWTGIGALMVTVEGAHKWWDVGPGVAAFVAEVDGARAITSDRHLSFRQVPPALATVLEIGSTSPGALLYDARKLYDSRDARAATELLEVLKAGDLPEAVAACLGAAAAEVDPSKQEALMQAGCYGRAFLALHGGNISADAGAYGGTQILNIARKLRVVNALRDPSVALPLTVPQLDALGLRRLGSRLASRRQYLLALRVCDALGASPEDVLLQWACDKIEASASSMPDEQLLGALHSKLDGKNGVKWARIAAHARAQGRTRLAAALADKEVCASDQVPLLIDLGEEAQALRRATEAGDPDLVFAVLHAMWRRAEMAGSTTGDAHRKVYEAVRGYPLALALLSSFLADSGTGAALGMFQALADHESVAAMHIQKASKAGSMNGDHEAEAAREWILAREAYALAEKAGKEDRFESGAAAAALRLREIQIEMQRSTGREGFLGLSAVGTIRHCLRLGLRDQAQRVAREFKVTEKQQMLLAVEAAAVSHDWSALQQMASKLDRRAPITMEHFVSAARAHGAPLATVRWFVDRITTGDNVLVRRAQLYADLGMHHEAAMLAEQAELQGAGSGVLGSLRDAVGGTVGSLVGRVAAGSPARN